MSKLPAESIVPELSTVHDALRRATTSEGAIVPLVNSSFKINPVKKEIVEQICRENGTSLSAFLRACADVLIVDYLGPKDAAALDASIPQSE